MYGSVLSGSFFPQNLSPQNRAEHDGRTKNKTLSKPTRFFSSSPDSSPHLPPAHPILLLLCRRRVAEGVEQGVPDSHKVLFSREEGRKAELDWARRYQVILGVARGLLYLHKSAHTTIIHRDIKASNILLDGRWTPKIADFGMARLYSENQTHVNTRVAGTNGYMAPEYVIHGILSVKADVFSFGILLLEIVAGRKNTAFAPLPDPDADNLLEWAWKLYEKGKSLDLLDRALSLAITAADAEQVAMCVQLGLLCTQTDPKHRPGLLCTKSVLVALSQKPATTALEEPMRPGIPAGWWRRRGPCGTRVLRLLCTG
ncbi:cysteine-rich receptor-like protein kinase 43 [Curcuma longa]|uniref:cysteine-rich receptor-like protein kinase 43 n=1 Tax=Curcuma longa TaxID=136217 RepID=UPI003D9E55C0